MRHSALATMPAVAASMMTAVQPPPCQSCVDAAPDSVQVPFVVNDAVKRGWTKVAIFADTTGYGEAGLKDVQDALAARSRARPKVESALKLAERGFKVFPVAAGQKCGELVVVKDGREIGKVDLVAEKPIARAGFFRIFQDMVGNLFKLRSE